MRGKKKEFRRFLRENVPAWIDKSKAMPYDIHDIRE